MRQTQEKLSNDTAKNPITVVVESKNQGGFFTKVFVRNHEILSDQPHGFNGQNQGPKPSELILAALAACQETTYRISALSNICVGTLKRGLLTENPENFQVSLIYLLKKILKNDCKTADDIFWGPYMYFLPKQNIDIQ